MNLREARIREERAALVRAPGRRHVRADGVGREVIDRPVAAGRQDDRIGGVALELAGHEVAHDDAARLAVDHHEVQHLAPREQAHRPLLHLPHQRLIGAEQQLLSGLAAGIKGARHLRPAERAVVQQPAVLAREGHPLRHALVDDVHAELRQPVDVRLARPVVAALDRVVEEAVHAVAVVLVILRRVDPALRRNAVRAPGAVLDAEIQNVVAQLAERRRGGRAAQPRADDDDRVLALVGRVDQLHLELVPVPFLREQTGRNSCVELHDRTPLKCAHSAMTMKPPAMRTAIALPAGRMNRVHAGLSRPSDWKPLEMPCHRCEPTTTIEMT